MNAPSAYPLAWPAGLPRSASRQNSQFKCSLSGAMRDLEDALRLFGKDTDHPVSGVVISSNVTLGVSNPADPGVAVYFDWDGAQRCIAVDRYHRIEHNIRAIYYVLEARRTEMRHGGLTIVRAAFKGFDALPAPDAGHVQDWRAELGLEAGADLKAAEAAYRQLARKHHPDIGGDPAKMARLNFAREAARRELRP